MRNGSYILGCLVALWGLMSGLCGCTDELEGAVSHSRPSDVISFTTSLSGSRAASMSRGASGHLAIEQEEWLVGVEKKQGASRGTPVSLLEGSAGVIGYVYDTWKEPMATDETGTLPWDILYNKQFNFDGDELTAASADIRWNQIANMANNNHVLFHAYAPFDLSGATLSTKTTGGTPTMAYRVDDDVTKQHDFIVASWTGAEGTNYGTSIQPQTIPLVFEHALTAVKFKVGFACTVTKLEVEGVYNSGTYTFGKGWIVNKTSTDANAQLTSDYTFTFGKNGAGKPFEANESLTDGDYTLMMIPQTLSEKAQIILYYKEENGTQRTVKSSLKDKVWQSGKMITYTIHKDQAPATIYFDLAAGNINIEKGTQKVTGYVYKKGESNRTKKTYTHKDDNIYYVYQSTEAKRAATTPTGVLDGETIILPVYDRVMYNGRSWAEFITNNTSVEDVIEVWDDGKYVREKGDNAQNEKHIGTAVVRDAERTHTLNHIMVKGSNAKFNLIVDNIYTTYQQLISDKLRGRSEGGISYKATGNVQLTINLVGDSRLGYVDIKNTSTDKIIFEGTGSLTVADADFITPKDIYGSPLNLKWDSNYYGTTESEQGYISNHRKSAIGNDTKSSISDVYNLIFNSGTIFAGTTKTENCSAIGGGGNGYGQVFINGGTVTSVATTTGSAIGGGIGFTDVGGVGEVHISGGNVYAYNLENRWGIPSSSIGGGGSRDRAGKSGNVYISGGYVYAYSALGTAIGGGSSREQNGGDATITITGGQVIAKSGKGAGIGGGSSRTIGTSASKVYNGGTARIKISGNPIVRTGSIGGGITGDPQGKLGNADITVEGGDIQAQFVMEAGSTEPPKFTMSGGTIRNSNVNDAEYIHIKENGGAVYLEDGTFTMTGGTIKNCSAEQGGAVYIERKSTISMAEGEFNFTMSGGEIHSCFATGKDATQGHGGAVYLNGGQVLMTGGKIKNNYSVNGDGGAVYISNGNFFMQDGSPEISGNSAQKGSGGGVFISSAGSEVSEASTVKVNLLRGSITGNSANNYGGGVCVDMEVEEEVDLRVASVIVGKEKAASEEENNTTPNISGNAAMLSGGGLYVRGDHANITIHGGNIKNNQVSAYVKNQNVANEGGEVTLNADNVTDFVTVTFNGNGGTIAGAETYEQKVVINTNSILTENQFINGGKNFVRWNNRPDNLGDISYDNGAKINISKDITLYAIWKDQ